MCWKMFGLFEWKDAADKSSAVRVAGRDANYAKVVGRAPIELGLDREDPERDGH